MQNLSLERVAGSQGLPLAGHGPKVTAALTAIAKKMDPEKDKLVLIARTDSASEINTVVEFFEMKGIQVDVHPMQDVAPLKFGMCGEFDN